MKDKVTGEKVRFSISVQLITIFSVLVIFALGLSTVLVSYFITDEERRTAEDNNHTVNSRTASAVESYFNSVESSVSLYLDISQNSTSSVSENFFIRNPEILGIFCEDEKGTVSFILPSDFLDLNQNSENAVVLTKKDAVEIQKAHSSSSASVFAGKKLYYNESRRFSVPIVSQLFMWQGENAKYAVTVIFYPQSLNDSFAMGAMNTSYLVSADGSILISGDIDKTMNGESIKGSALYDAICEYKEQNRQMLFTDEKEGDFFGAFTRILNGELITVTTISSDIVYEAGRSTFIRNIFLSCAIFFLCIMLIWFWSKSISTPVKQLAAAAGRIGNGEYEVQMERKRKDELKILTDSFVKMGHGLAERERLKDAFGRFTNKEIAEKAMRNELSLGGENKNVTVFFSDIRSFTAMSEKLTPEQVVEFLNEYMTRMVKCVDATGGVVDKFIGDAIMAVWGAPVSAGSPKEDALNGIKASLLMRKELYELNKERVAKGLIPVHIGCGLNSGDVIAGQIGSEKRMEYTVIGDTVNTASRTEALNKPFHTDVLITENTWQLVKDEILVEEMPGVKVKGKTDKLRMFAVIGFKDSTKFTSYKQVRALLGVSEPDLAAVNPDEEEKKYEVVN
jgi:adenylate cyclase